MTSKQRISIYGNCQSIALASSLSVFADFRKKFELVKMEPIHSITAASLASFIKDVLPTLDALLYQPVRSSYRGGQPFGSDYALEQLNPKSRAISFPSIQFFGYYPSHLLFKNTDQSISTLSQQLLGMKISELYHYRQVVEAFLSGKSVAQAVEAFDQVFPLDDEQVLARKAASQQHLFEAEHHYGIDIRVGKFIENRYKQALLFHTPSHPNGEVLGYVCRQIAERLGVETKPEEIQAATALEPLNIITYPIQKFAAEVLSLNFPLPRTLSVPRKSINLEIGEMVERYYALYEALGLEKVAENVQGYAATNSHPPANQIRKAQAKVFIPATAKTGEAFLLRTENIPAGAAVFADKKHALGTTGLAGTKEISLLVAGPRTIDVKLDDEWISSAIHIRDAGPLSSAAPSAERAAAPRLSVPATVSSGEPFAIHTENIAAGTLVLADKTHVLGKLDPQGTIRATLSAPGLRSIDVKVGKHWLSAHVTVLKQDAKQQNIEFDEQVSFDEFKIKTLNPSTVQLNPVLGLSEPSIRDLTKGFTEGTWPMLKPGYEVKEIQVFNLQGPVILGHTGFIAVNGHLFEPSLTPVYRNSWRTKLGGMNAHNPKRLEGTYACIFNWTHKNYWHWHLQCLPNILVLEELGLLDGVTLVAPTLKSWQRDSLALMGIPAQQILEIEDQPYRFENLLFSTLISGHNRDLPAICVRIFDRIKSNLGIAPGRTSKLYLSRFDTRLRKIVNEDEVAAALGSMGYEPFTPGQFSYQEQVRKLASARFVVGNHGAGLTNMGFAGHGALLEIFPETYLRGGYRVQCSLLGQPYSFRTYPVIKNGREREAHHHDGLRWQVPVDDLLADVMGFEELVGQGQ